MLRLASAIPTALDPANHRNTRTGDACRSAIAPKISGEIKAATAEVANAYGASPGKPCAANTRLSGTIHIPVAIDWKKKSTASSPYSAQLFAGIRTRSAHLTLAKMQAFRFRPFVGQALVSVTSKCAGIFFTTGQRGGKVALMKKDLPSDAGNLLAYLPRWRSGEICLPTC